MLGSVLLPATYGHGAEGLRVELGDGRLTVQAHEVALRDLLEEIARHTGLVVSFPNAPSKRVTTQFDALELPAAIDRLLHGMSYALQYAPDGSAGRLWVFSSGETKVGASEDPGVDFGAAEETGVALDDDAAMRLEAVAALADQETDPFAFALASAIVDESPAVRFEAVYALGEIGGAVSTGFLRHALTDSDADVRGAAVDAFAEIGGEPSANALADVLTDPDPALRENAVYALGEIGGETAVGLLREASSDADEWVREAAVEMLRELESAE